MSKSKAIMNQKKNIPHMRNDLARTSRQVLLSYFLGFEIRINDEECSAAMPSH